ncbi:MAG TPA: inositol monophosphatase family protein [Vicinamibacterales bacterium]|nr:inositol monophosphatase family protein [Vicinamibacterales bacterium]
MNSPDPKFLATAIEAVVRAGEMQRAHVGSDLHVEKKGSIDLVTEVDLAVERMFREMIANRFPDHSVLAEEMGEIGAASTYRWVFDPLDGTTNYAHGIPIYCATLALEIEGVPTVGAVFDPNRNELFTAERGVGAWLNGRPLHVSSTSSLDDAVLVTGFPYDIRERLKEALGLFGAFLSHARAVRRLGSAAIDLCWVAAGRMDGFWEQGLQVWDTMAGAIVVEEAGGRVSSLDGTPWKPHDGQILASNSHVHDQMVGVIRDYMLQH